MSPMLTKLSVSNLAILENVDVTFKKGFTVLTGGTGAGKSLVIDSLSLLLAERASSELIRAGEERAVIQGTFEVDSPRLSAVLAELRVPSNPDGLLIERTISKTKNSIKANGMSLTLSDLSKIARHLADIHNQLDFAKILNPENYLSMIDGFSLDLVTPYLDSYKEALAAYRSVKADYEKLLEEKRKIEEDRDFLEFQKKELDAFDLKEGEEEEIEKEIALLKNKDAIYSLSVEAKEILSSDAIDRLYDLSKSLDKLSSYQPQFKDYEEKIRDHYFELDDLASRLKKEFGALDYDPKSLDELEERLVSLSSLKRKYRKSIPELIEYHARLSSMLGKGEDLEGAILDAKRSKDEARAKAIKKGAELTLVRKRIASSIEKELCKNLSDLLLRSRFEVKFEERKDEDDSYLLENGVDQIEFLIETNVGEGLRSLYKTVSGGEASRVMLAFKAVFLKANRVATAVFDEIDSGLSGEEAMAVARKIAELSLFTQVIAITHLPQMASKADHQYLISKSEEGGRTRTSIKELDLNERIEEIAHLISGGQVTKKQTEYAKEMLLGK